MINRDISGAVLEIANRISTRLHYLFDQSVGFANGLRWFIDETCLRFLPRLGKATLFFWCQRPNLELANALFPPRKFCFGLTLIAVLVDCSLVLRSEVLTQAFRTASSDEND